MLLPHLLNDKHINEEEVLCIVELSKLLVTDNKVYQMLLEKESIDVNEFYEIAFAFLEYGYFHLFINFTIHYQELLSNEINECDIKAVSNKEDYINEIIENFKKISEIKNRVIPD